MIFLATLVGLLREGAFVLVCWDQYHLYFEVHIVPSACDQMGVFINVRTPTSPLQPCVCVCVCVSLTTVLCERCDLSTDASAPSRMSAPLKHAHSPSTLRTQVPGRSTFSS